MSSTTTPALAAVQLRKFADALDQADPKAEITAYVSFGADYMNFDQEARIKTVDTVAALFGLTAEPTKVGTSSWYHKTEDERDGVRLVVDTHISAPAQRCACGAVCTHTATGGA